MFLFLCWVSKIWLWAWACLKKKTFTAPRWNIKHSAVISESHIILQESCAVNWNERFLLTALFFRHSRRCSVIRSNCSTCCNFRRWVKPQLIFPNIPMKLTNWKTTMFHSHKLNTKHPTDEVISLWTKHYSHSFDMCCKLPLLKS